MRHSGIYAIFNVATQQYYVGQSLDCLDRIRHHRYALNKGIHKNKYLQNSWKKYGESSFSFTFICCALGEGKDEIVANLNHLETFFIGLLNSFRDGYNLTTGGNSCVVSEKSIQKNREVHLGLPGHPCSPETREKIRASKIGWSPSPETRKKMSESSKGRKPWNLGKTGYKVGPASEERKKKIGESQKGEKNHNFGKIIPEEVKAKIRASNGGSKCYLAKLTESQVAIIKQRIEAGDVQAQIARDYGVAAIQITHIKQGKTWRHVPSPNQEPTSTPLLSQ